MVTAVITKLLTKDWHEDRRGKSFFGNQLIVILPLFSTWTFMYRCLIKKNFTVCFASLQIIIFILTSTLGSINIVENSFHFIIMPSVTQSLLVAKKRNTIIRLSCSIGNCLFFSWSDSRYILSILKKHFDHTILLLRVEITSTVMIGKNKWTLWIHQQNKSDCEKRKVG